MQSDLDFDTGKLKFLLRTLSIPSRPVPPASHAKNPIKSKQGVIRSIFSRIKEAAGESYTAHKETNESVLISNNRNRNNILSFLELAKAFAKPTNKRAHKLVIPASFTKVYESNKTRRKLACILSSKDA